VKKTLAICAVALMAVAGTGMAALINYDSNSDNGSQWVHAPVGYGTTYVSPADAYLTFYTSSDAVISPPGLHGGAWKEDGWVQGSFNYAGSSLDMYGRVDIHAGALNGAYYVFPTQHFDFPNGNEIVQYYTGGTPQDGTGWILPEPTSILLYALGMVAVTLGSRIARRK
jgi:hypothetical protein